MTQKIYSEDTILFISLNIVLSTLKINLTWIPNEKNGHKTSYLAKSLHYKCIWISNCKLISRHVFDIQIFRSSYFIKLIRGELVSPELVPPVIFNLHTVGNSNNDNCFLEWRNFWLIQDYWINWKSNNLDNHFLRLISWTQDLQWN